MLLLEPHVGDHVLVGGVDAFVTKHDGDSGFVGARRQHGHRTGVAKVCAPILLPTSSGWSHVALRTAPSILLLAPNLVRWPTPRPRNRQPSPERPRRSTCAESSSVVLSAETGTCDHAQRRDRRCDRLLPAVPGLGQLDRAERRGGPPAGGQARGCGHHLLSARHRDVGSLHETARLAPHDLQWHTGHASPRVPW